ncbi:PAS domain-containing hybrid sensor histidine kinase/response regulator [Alteromonas lipolytica]|uniref:histidine kinase n=1 Tax=Alteromonas lipolytica TaxID=1856405 RepID=A0A1E8FK22_9ALTE|nr:PAS-domain containing protein [Alteromonas lipolytica]OFI36272.1 hybrid sensor histidine kinase/response regulator [Alteromonas lipolytica]GGF79285.1 two-component sensor [Alteromonas lipolytica]
MTFGWVSLALLYLFLLFYIASWGDKNSTTARWITSHPVIYSLALAIYCTAWTFFGAVGQATRDTWIYLPILLGPILVYILGYKFIYKLTLVSKKQHINTIADFIASRYGKRQAVALLVTIIALMATIPYIALQLKAIGATFKLLTNQPNSQFIIVLATAFIALFAIYFGTKQTDVTEYRRGLILAISFESSIKLLALVLVAIVGYQAWYQQENTPILENFLTDEALSQFSSFTFFAQVIMAAAAIICLPRQFHVAIVDNLSLNHLKTARWLFPLYLGITAAVIPIIAMAGQAVFADNPIEPDTYVLSLAMYSESFLLQVIVFVGGLSAATAMIIVATLTLSTMLTNDVVLPRLLAVKEHSASYGDYGKRIRLIRRIIIGIILLLAFLYHQQMTGSRSLHSIGLIAFSLVIQLLPAVIGGLYWKRGHAHGVYAGLMVGLITWVLWLVLPIVNDAATDFEQSELLSQGAIISLITNSIAYGLFSWFAPARLIDRIQAEAFVSPAEVRNTPLKSQSVNVTIADLITLLSTFMGTGRCKQLVNEYQQLHHTTIENSQVPDDAFMAFCERALGGVIGASSAKALIDSVLRGKKLDFTEVINFFDDTTQAMQFNMTALLTSLENMDQGISVIDKHLNLVAWNKQYAALYNYPEDLLVVGTPIEKMMRYNAQQGEFGAFDIEAEVEKRLEHLRSGTPHRFTRQRSDGRVIEMVGNPLPGGGFVTSFNDITGHVEIQQALEESNIDLEHRIKKRTEEVHSINAELRLEIERRRGVEKELIRARKQAEDANASKTRFLALASHDVLQPLNAAKLYVSALQEAQLPETVKNIVNKLNHSVSSSEALIATLLDISRLDQGELKPNPEPVNIKDLSASIVDELSMRAKDKGLELRTYILDCWVYADKTFLYRIIQNLLSNAVKYTDKGKVLFSTRRRAGKILIEIRDTGIGISEEQQALIFSDFYRTNESSEHGIGLGLGVVRRLSNQMQCKVQVKSEVGKGSCFSISFPMTQPKVVRSASLANPTASFSGLRVLCVDDQQENLDALQTLLEKWGVSTVLADNWDDAITQADIFSPQILLMDYQLGNDQNGLDLIDAIRQHLDIVLPASLVTATHDEDVVTRCKEQGVNYLSKPIKPAKLRALLKSMTRYIKSAH